jgi:hypothetical protein
MDPLIGASRKALQRRCIRLEGALDVAILIIESQAESNDCDNSWLHSLLTHLKGKREDLSWKTPQVGDDDYRSNHSVDENGYCNMGCC